MTNLSAVARPETGKVSATDIHESDNMVARMMRLGPGASSKEHHHPFFDETIFVHSGTPAERSIWRSRSDGGSFYMRFEVKWLVDPRTEICHSSAGS
ncbi:hypothetical protein [Polyangium sp. 15x6]|uniref:hypothetical protein n=1 Tax=Polyangium sp. 15x6 TaxID=3042687 RepID=UPI00249AA3A4|nr:hypothetical protein [Polyangium sp. 15x6]MDI3289301.1 hypothetical protein [Polyangium sp. 15x6]